MNGSGNCCLRSRTETFLHSGNCLNSHFMHFIFASPPESSHLFGASTVTRQTTAPHAPQTRWTEINDENDHKIKSKITQMMKRSHILCVTVNVKIKFFVCRITFFTFVFLLGLRTHQNTKTPNLCFFFLINLLRKNQIRQSVQCTREYRFIRNQFDEYEPLSMLSASRHISNWKQMLRRDT